MLKSLSCMICSSVLKSLWLFLCKLLYRVTLLESPINSNQAEHRCKKELLPGEIHNLSRISFRIFFKNFQSFCRIFFQSILSSFVCLFLFNLVHNFSIYLFLWFCPILFNFVYFCLFFYLSIFSILLSFSVIFLSFYFVLFSVHFVQFHFLCFHFLSFV